MVICVLHKADEEAPLPEQSGEVLFFVRFIHIPRLGGLLMNVVFVNSFEKRMEDDRLVTAQVAIHEQHGVWQVHWQQPDATGERMQEVWFEGDKWQEMLSAFRMKLAEKAADGYLPLIDGSFDGQEDASGKATFTRMLHYYSESNLNTELFEQLRKWRRDQATAEKKPSYLIATNRVLHMIACFVPKSSQDLLSIPGFGEHKTGLYGKAILAITESHQQHTAFPLDWVVANVDLYAFKLWQHKQRELKLKTAHEKKEARKKLLELIHGGQSLEQVVEQLKLPRREIVLWLEELDGEGYDLDTWIDTELEHMPALDRERAVEALRSEGDRYLKPVLKKMYSDEELKDKDVDRMYEWLRLMRLRYRKEKAS